MAVDVASLLGKQATSIETEWPRDEPSDDREAQDLAKAKESSRKTVTTWIDTPFVIQAMTPALRITRSASI